MNFISSIIESTGIIEQMFGADSKQMRSYHRVLQGYAIKKTKSKEDIKAKFISLTQNQTTDKATNEKIQEVLLCM